MSSRSEDSTLGCVADNKTFSNEPWDSKIGQNAGPVLVPPESQFVETGSEADPIILVDSKSGTSGGQDLHVARKRYTGHNPDTLLCNATTGTFSARLKSVLTDGERLVEKCESQQKEIIRLRYEAQGMQYRKSVIKEKYWMVESERQRASKNAKDLGEKVRDLEEQVQRLETKLERIRCVICLVGFSDTVLSCGHIFCQECLAKLGRATTGQSTTCPMCRVESNFSLLIYGTS
ncbi:MAG: hypothetical protein Q9213_001788 [Squamulea squamosa]